MRSNNVSSIENQVHILTFKDKIRRITYMEKAEIKQIAAYLKDLEEGLVELDFFICAKGSLAP